IHFHQIQGSGLRVLFEFHHRHAMPSQPAEYANRALSETWVNRCAFPENADAASWRLLAQSPVTELANQTPAIEEHEDTETRTDDALLNERRTRREIRHLSIEANQRTLGLGVMHRGADPTTLARYPRARRLDDGWIANVLEDARQRRQAVYANRTRDRH